MPLKGREGVEKAIEDTVIVLNKKLSAIYIKGLGDIIRATPVHFDGGGGLKNNWFLTVKSPSTKERGGNAGGSSSFAEVGKMPNVVLGKKIYFTNNRPYAIIGEYGGYPNPPKVGTWTGNAYQKLSAGGYSRQAPNGMVRISIKKMKAKVKKL